VDKGQDSFLDRHEQKVRVCPVFLTMMSRVGNRFNDGSGLEFGQKDTYLRARYDRVAWLSVDVVEAAASQRHGAEAGSSFRPDEKSLQIAPIAAIPD
jgi:hypothetical protein